MNRRNFLQNGAAAAAGTLAAGALTTSLATAGPVAGSTAAPHNHKGSEGNPGAASAGAAGLATYQPRPEKPWNARRVAHLLRRLGYGFTWKELSDGLDWTPEHILSAFMLPSLAPSAPGAWATQPPFTQITNAERTQYYSWARDMQEWWVELMLNPSLMFREKMVLFWHNHFVSEFPTVQVTQYMYRQNQLFREFAFGDFKALTKKVTIDPAMLVYLDGATSRAGNPNENYARELLELFAIGIGNYASGAPHYTERDVVELARALTGWTVNGLESEFRPARFDNGSKSIFSQSANFGIEGKGDRDIIDYIFDQQDHDLHRSRSAIFICTKLYQAFVHDVPDMAIVVELANKMLLGFGLGQVLYDLFTSEHFFDDNVMGAKIKSPAEFVLGAIRDFGLNAPMSRNTTDIARPETHDPVTAMGHLSQILLYPPNVKGWPGGRSWISSATLPLRMRYTKMWLEPVPGALDYGFDPVAHVKSIPDFDDAEKLLDNLLVLHLPIDVSTETRALLLDELLAGGPVYEWDPDAPNAAARIRACLIRMTNLGEYQLI